MRSAAHRKRGHPGAVVQAVDGAGNAPDWTKAFISC